MEFPKLRLRRLRRTKLIRELVRQAILAPTDLIFPIFLKEGINTPEPIEAMPGHFRFPVDDVIPQARELVGLGIPGLILFGIPKHKDKVGSSAYDTKGVVQTAVRSIKKELGEELVVITDVCLCQYTDYGHCGIVEGNKILNDPTLEVLQKIAVSHAEAGADIVAPSGMIDGQIKAIRAALDRERFEDTIIMSYAAKYASVFYGPFREAAASVPSFGDRRSYQMDPANADEAIREVELDLREGSDIILIKPALSYLDIIYRVKNEFKVPVAAYNVSGEFGMIEAAIEKGWLDQKLGKLEVLTSIKRAGADLILTYWAKEVARWLKK